MASHWTWRLALAIAGLGLGGCSEDDFDCIPSPGPINQVERAPGVVVAGQRVRMEVTPASGSPAVAAWRAPFPSPPRPRSKVRTVSPSRTSSPWSSSPGWPRSSSSPAAPGSPPHHRHVLAHRRAPPVRSHAAWDRSAEAPSEPLPLNCSSLERTSKGAWVCDTSVVRGSTVVKSFPGTSLAVAGDVIWVVGSLNIQRFVDTGADLVLSATYAHRNGTTRSSSSPRRMS